MLQLLYPSLMTKLSTSPFKKFSTKLKETLLHSHEFTKLRNCWTFGMAFNRVQLY